MTISLCKQCHHYFDEGTGLVVPSLAHIKIEQVDDKLICKECQAEMDIWPKG